MEFKNPCLLFCHCSLFQKKTTITQEVSQKGSCGALARALDLIPGDLHCIPGWPAVCCRVSRACGFVHIPFQLLIDVLSIFEKLCSTAICVYTITCENINKGFSLLKVCKET